MGIGKSLGDFSRDACEYVKRSVDGYKLLLVEKLSLVLGGLMCNFVVAMLLFVAYLLLLAVLVIVLHVYIGIVCSLLTAAFLLMILALMVYRFRIKLFVDGFVAILCRHLFGDENDDDGK